jgi:hypothetical protein
MFWEFGTYLGATASATVGVGVGANVLIGGSGNTISLQPLSIEDNTGLNVAARTCNPSPCQFAVAIAVRSW